RSAVRATVESAPQVATHARVRYIVPEQAPLVEIILVFPGRPAAVLRRSVAAIIARTTYPHYRITLAGAEPVEPELLQLFEQWSGDPRIRISLGGSVTGYARLVNQAVDASVADLICLLDSSLDVISPDWLGEMAGHALQSGVGAVGARLLYPDNTLQYGGVILGLGGSFGYAHQGCPRAAAGYFGRAVLQQEFSAVSGSCLLVARQRYLAAGGLEEQYLSKEFAAIDFCLKLKEQGLRTLWTPYAELCNRADTDIAAHQSPYAADVCYLQRRWGTVLADDPCYSPNLALEAPGASFGLAWPPRLRQLPVV
ncbi:MAG: glycosyltransferase, partial [Geobacteraceae bacterium]|nr:glycosyltransferase [Geobacteraceae bacterium]